MKEETIVEAPMAGMLPKLSIWVCCALGFIQLQNKDGQTKSISLNGERTFKNSVKVGRTF